MEHQDLALVEWALEVDLEALDLVVLEVLDQVDSVLEEEVLGQGLDQVEDLGDQLDMDQGMGLDRSLTNILQVQGLVEHWEEELDVLDSLVAQCLELVGPALLEEQLVSMEQERQ